MGKNYIYIELPHTVSKLESQYVYTAWNFMAEFGGWVGIFLGVCVTDVYSLVEGADKCIRKFKVFN